MKIFNIEQIKAWDRYTIENEPIESLDLMKRAAQKFTEHFTKIYDRKKKVVIFCGQGNNGGDGLVVARMLHAARYELEVYICQIGKPSVDFEYMMKYKVTGEIDLNTLRPEDKLPKISSDCIIIDALFGTGLNKELTGFAVKMVAQINDSGAEIVSIDIPSGMFADKLTTGISIHAHRTISFECPKTAFFLKSNHARTGVWDIVRIGLHAAYLANTATNKYMITADWVKSNLKRRHKYDHKGSFGHALLIVGSKGKVGAAVLSAKGCLRSGAGLLTLHIPACAYEIVQICIPEAMTNTENEEDYITTLPENAAYDAIGIGSGIGKSIPTLSVLKELLLSTKQPIVLDADALNLISEHPEMLLTLPNDCILTPHPKEFQRLFGTSADDFESLRFQQEKSRQLGVYIILKGGHTCITTPEGDVYFNTTGNPGMATAGSGDVLTGIITGLLAQGYTPLQAATLGVYLHGLAGDLAAKEMSMESLIAGEYCGVFGEGFFGGAEIVEIVSQII